jgi:hypothetical protein
MAMPLIVLLLLELLLTGGRPPPMTACSIFHWFSPSTGVAAFFPFCDPIRLTFDTATRPPLPPASSSSELPPPPRPNPPIPFIFLEFDSVRVDQMFVDFRLLLELAIESGEPAREPREEPLDGFWKSDLKEAKKPFFFLTEAVSLPPKEEEDPRRARDPRRPSAPPLGLPLKPTSDWDFLPEIPFRRVFSPSSEEESLPLLALYVPFEAVERRLFQEDDGAGGGAIGVDLVRGREEPTSLAVWRLARGLFSTTWTFPSSSDESPDSMTDWRPRPRWLPTPETARRGRRFEPDSSSDEYSAASI